MKLKQNVQPLNIITKWTPLIDRFGILVEAGSKTQFYYTNEGQFIPSRAVTPLKLVASLHIVDPDGQITTGNKVSSCDVKWYEGSYDTQITADMSGYTLGEDKSLTVSKNVLPNNPLQILVRCTYIDPRNGNTLVYEDSCSLNSISKTDNVHSVTLDKPAKMLFNPISDDSTVMITATLKLGSEVVADANAKYWWYIVNNGVETLIDQAETAIEYISGQGTKTLAVNAMYTNQSIIRVKAVSYEGTAPTTPPSLAAHAECAIIYSVPNVRSMTYTPNSTTIHKGDTDKTFRCEVSTNREILTDAQVNAHFLVRWYKKPTTAGGVESRIGDGISITVPVSELTLQGRKAMQVYANVYAFGAYGYKVNSDGKMITTDDGKAILART